MSSNHNPDNQEHGSRRTWWNPVDLDSPKALRHVRDGLGFVTAGLVACLIFKAPSDAVLALGCAGAIVGSVAAGQRLEMIGLRRRIEALECTHKGGEGTKGN
jgi:hypothetical protein